MLFNIEIVNKNKLLNSKLLTFISLIMIYCHFTTISIRFVSIWKTEIFYTVLQTLTICTIFPHCGKLPNYLSLESWRILTKIDDISKIKIVLSFKCHVTFRLQTKRTFQTSRIKIKNQHQIKIM